MDLKEEEFKRYDYTFDKSTRVSNVINEQGKLQDGINFINLFKLIRENLKQNKEEENVVSSYKPSNLIREFYDDIFFTSNLNIPKKKIEEFLIFCDDNFPSRILLKKDNEFELIDFLVKQSEKYQKILN